MFCILIVLFVPFFAQSQIHINEFMAYPHSGSPEWIELYNPDSHTVCSIHALSIEDATSKVILEDFTILPNQYIVITRDTASLQHFGGSIPSLLIQAQLPTLNNAKDKIMIRTQDGILIDSLSYMFKKEFRGKSLERNTDSTYSLSMHPIGHTCGYSNSNIPLNLDLQLSSIQMTSDTLFISVLNNGHIMIEEIEMSINSTIHTWIQKLDSLHGNEVHSFTIPLTKLDMDQGKNFFTIRTRHSKQDPREYNNDEVFEYYHSYPRRSVSINEINVSEHSFPEFIEFKRNEAAINLNDGYACIIDTDTIPLYTVDTSQYMILTKTNHVALSGLSCVFNQGFRLSDEGNIIKIIDPTGTIMDSIDTHMLIDSYSSYVSSNSIEYTDSLQQGTWFISLDMNGATPGKHNTVFKQNSIGKYHVSLENCSDSYVNCQTINIQHPFSIGIYTCDVYTLDGYFVTSIIMEKLIPSEHILSLDGISSLHSSVYILLHKVKDYYGDERFMTITPCIKRN